MTVSRHVQRATSCWVALDDTTVDNGTMWFVPGSHKEPSLRPHRLAAPGSHVLVTDECSEAEGVPGGLSLKQTLKRSVRPSHSQASCTQWS